MSRERENSVLEPKGRDQNVIGRLGTSAKGKGGLMRAGPAVAVELRLGVRTATARGGLQFSPAVLRHLSSVALFSDHYNAISECCYLFLFYR